MKVLVTGGAGFIGSHIVEHYLEEGAQVWAIDNIETGAKENLPSHPNLHFDCVKMDEWEGLSKAVMWADLIFHTAASVGMHNVIEHPFYTLTNNLKTLRVLLEMLNRSSHLIYLSSSGVYWNSQRNEKGAFDEETPLIIHAQDYVQEAYSLSKLTCEVLALNASKEKGFQLKVPRIFNTVGVRQTGKYGMVLPRFVQQALRGEPLTVYGDGHQTRSFINVHDTVHALARLAICEEANREIVNVGNDREITILELAHLVKEVVGSKSEIAFIPHKEVFGFDFRDVCHRRPSIEKLRRLTGFSPAWTLEETIGEVARSLQL